MAELLALALELGLRELDNVATSERVKPTLALADTGKLAAALAVTLALPPSCC
jgi:hypothetical protein